MMAFRSFRSDSHPTTAEMQTRHPASQPDLQNRQPHSLFDASISQMALEMKSSGDLSEFMDVCPFNTQGRFALEQNEHSFVTSSTLRWSRPR